jgi:LuxR family maltose regulon positive regulatory protein
LVPRPRLIERLNDGLRRKLTLISAPAGFGKTTLLSEWVHSPLSPGGRGQGEGRRVAWLSLDEGDNDPARFWAYFVAALQTVEAGIGKGVLGALQSPQPPPVESALAALINELAAIPTPFILILDDYHLVTAQPVHDAIAFLLDHLPPPMHFGIATRADPPLPIARLRARGQLTELRQADLRFTPGEAKEFLNQMMELEISADDVSALASRTEGWIAGLQMAALALQATTSTPEQETQHATSLIRAFSGSNRFILDYLVEEVLQRQPESIQTFLLQTSILDRLTGPLCDAVLGNQQISKSANQQIGKRAAFADLQICRFADLSGHEVLDYLERANLFIVPLDDRREWYRYHRLFSDLLRSRLLQAQPDLVPTLHRRASEWYEQHGLIPEAIEHALSAEDFERAAHLVDQVAEATLMRSEIVTFLNWAERLPETLVRARPSLCLFHAWALLMSGRPLDVVESRLEDIDRDTGLIPGKVNVLRAFIAILQGHMSSAVELARQALDELPEDDLFLRNVTTWILSFSRVAAGDFEAGSQALDEVARTGQQIGNILIAARAQTYLAGVHIRLAHLRKAQGCYEQALEIATDPQGRRLPVAGMAMIGLGELMREWNDLETASRYLAEGIELARQWSKFAALEGYITLARVKQAQGDADGAREAIEEARQMAVQFEATDIDDLVVAMSQAQFWVAQGNLEAAMSWVRERGLDRDIDLAELDRKDDFVNYHLRKYEYLILARMWIAQAQPDKALSLLEPLRLRMEQQGRTRLVIEIHMLEALAYQARGDVAQALACLEQALSLAEPEGYVRLFVDEGEPMAGLLCHAAARGIAAGYVSRLLAALGAEEQRSRGTEGQGSGGAGEQKFSPAPPHLCSPALIEPLSERELQVLRLLPTALSSTEMAQALFVSVNTVRSHLKSIYTKLSAHSRYEAVARAKELNLL